jgi:hypothetical protein
MKNEQSKIQQPSRPIEMKILRLATLLSEGDDDLDHDGLRLVLDSAGSDSAVLTARLHAAALRLVEDLRSQGETVPLSLERKRQTNACRIIWGVLRPRRRG